MAKINQCFTKPRHHRKQLRGLPHASHGLRLGEGDRVPSLSLGFGPRMASGEFPTEVQQCKNVETNNTNFFFYGMTLY